MVTRPAATASPGNLLEVQILRLHLSPVQSETLEMGPAICVYQAFQVILLDYSLRDTDLNEST